MFTDSAFYDPKFHPSVAKQVEMAHALSSSLYGNDNKQTKGQEMFLKRAKKSGKWVTTNQVGMLSSKIQLIKILVIFFKLLLFSDLFFWIWLLSDLDTSMYF